MRAAVVALVVLLAAVASADEVAASKDAIFRRGNDAFFHARFDEAAQAYEQVAALGVRSVDLFYNLGNAYLKKGLLGPAVYNYERALELDPRDEDAQFNLKAAREAAKHLGEDRLVGAETPPLWMRLVMPYTLGLLSWVFLGLYVSLFTLLLVLHFVQPGFLRVGLWAAFAFVTLAAVASGAVLGGRLYLAERVEQAIVIPDSVQVREGPDANYTALFSVHAGLRVRISEKEQEWARVRLGNGLEGWLREAELGRL